MVVLEWEQRKSSRIEDGGRPTFDCWLWHKHLTVSVNQNTSAFDHCKNESTDHRWADHSSWTLYRKTMHNNDNEHDLFTYVALVRSLQLPHHSELNSRGLLSFWYTQSYSRSERKCNPRRWTKLKPEHASFRAALGHIYLRRGVLVVSLHSSYRSAVCIGPRRKRDVSIWTKWIPDESAYTRSMAKSFDWVKERATDGSQGKCTTTIINNTPRAKEIKVKIEYSLSPSSN